MIPRGMFRPALALAILTIGAATIPAAQPDFAKAHEEIVTNLRAFIGVDTMNPPGNETRGAKFLQDLLARDGIASEIYEKEAGRGNLVARLKGSGGKQPLLLLGHLDTVGVQRDQWTVDPFAAEIKDGYLYGRGALDDKGMLTVCLEVMLLLKRLNVPLERDVIFLAEAGEEGTPQVGIDYMVNEHWDKIACEFAINEGGELSFKDGRVHYVGVSTTEKVPRPVFLYAKGTSGHGSKPLLDNPVVHLGEAVARLGRWQPPLRLNETTRVFFERLAKISPPEEAFLYENLEDPVLGETVQMKLWQSKPGYNSMLRTSVSPNIIEGGFRRNVIPTDARAQVDVRALPDEDPEKFVELLRQVVNNPRVEVVMSASSQPAPPPSRLDNEMFRAFERVQQRMFPDATTLPVMITGATDSAPLRGKGVQAYGIGCLRTEEDALRMHGDDERVQVAGLRTFIEYLYAVVLEVAAK
ncbi:MAG TPA: peptidase M20 [Verrucomicrobiales bacterium]|nr:peptidase M20 [Verrucomicrobiales bacterium]